MANGPVIAKNRQELLYSYLMELYRTPSKQGEIRENFISNIVVVFCCCVLAGMPMAQFQEIQKLPGSGGRFGETVDIDAHRMIIGAPGVNSAYIYEFNVASNSWTLTCTLTRPGSQAFGYAVCIDGDQAMVGDYGYNNNQGIAYIYEYNLGQWELAATLSSNANQPEFFGTSVAIAGEHALVGAAYHEGSKGVDQGAVYAFKKVQSQWNTQYYQFIEGEEADDFFGKIAISGTRMIVGAGGHDTTINGVPFANAGKAYIYEYSSLYDSWITNVNWELKDADLAVNDNFGVAVDIDGNTAIVGVPNNGYYRNGAICIFEFENDQWQLKTFFLGAIAYANLGYAVCVSGTIVAAGGPQIWPNPSGGRIC